MGAFNGSGTFVRSYNWGQDASNGIPITASRFDTEDDGFAGGLSNCITRDGQGGPSANIPWNGYGITNVTVTMLTGSQVADSAGGNHPVGFRDIPQNLQAGAYIVTLSDVGKHVYISTGGITVPLNSTVAFPVGSAVTIINNSATGQNVAPAGGVTLYLAGTNTTGTRTISGHGLGTLIKTATDEWYFSGAGVA